MFEFLNNIDKSLEKFERNGVIVAKSVDIKGFYYQFIHPSASNYVITTYELDERNKSIICHSVDFIHKSSNGFDIVFKDQLFCEAGLVNPFHLEQAGDGFTAFNLSLDAKISDLVQYQKYPLLTYANTIKKLLESSEDSNPVDEVVNFIYEVIYPDE